MAQNKSRWAFKAMVTFLAILIIIAIIVVGVSMLKGKKNEDEVAKGTETSQESSSNDNYYGDNTGVSSEDVASNSNSSSNGSSNSSSSSTSNSNSTANSSADMPKSGPESLIAPAALATVAGYLFVYNKRLKREISLTR